jgi:hypothetical protein
MLKPLQRSLQASGLFPPGAPGEIYAHVWQTQIGQLLAQSIDLLPGWMPPAARPSRVELPSWAGGAGGDRLSVSWPAPAVTARPAARPGPPSGAEPQTEIALQARALAPFQSLIDQAAELTGIAGNWLRAVILQESSGRPNAVSPKGAQGLMQLLPPTARALGVRNPLDPAQNIAGGARYLAGLWRRFGEPALALAAYNAGPSRVEQYGGVPPFPETRRYVARVLELKQQLDLSWSPKPRP